MPFKPPLTRAEKRADGSWIVENGYALGAMHRSIAHLLAQRAAEHPDRPLIAQRVVGADMKTGDWRFMTYGEANARADRVVPPSGYTATLTLLTAGAMAFLAVFALALSLSTGHLADRWTGALARTATVRISAPADQLETQLPHDPAYGKSGDRTHDHAASAEKPWRARVCGVI